MHNNIICAILIAAVTTGFAGVSQAQTQAPATPAPAPAATPPLFATTKVEGTDNVYIFRYQNHQAMFVVTPAGVIATDPISYGRPQAAVAYVDEIRKITKAPIKYLIYSHHHYDHIAGGKPFKEAGATVVAHRRAKERLAALKGHDVVIPDQVVDGKRTIKLGGTTLELRLHRTKPFRLVAGDVPAQGEDHLRGRLQLARRGAVAARGQRFLSDRVGGLAEEDSGAELGAPDSRPSRARRPARHQEGHGAAARLPDRPFDAK